MDTPANPEEHLPEASWPTFCAPARVNLLGEHTDYTGGMVLPMAIPFQTRVKIRPGDDGVSTLRSSLFPEVRRLKPGEPLVPDDSWADYPLGVLHEFEKLGIRVPAFTMEFESNVPFGAGLSSSASIEVATCMGLLKLSGATMSGTEIALLCQRAENQFVKSPCGIMDQAVITMARAGHALLLNTRDLTFELVPMNHGGLKDVSVVVVNSEVKHSIAAGGYGGVRRQAEEGQAAMVRRFGIRDLGEARPEQVAEMADELASVILRRVRHIVTENARVLRARDAMVAGDARQLGEILLEGHASMRDDYEITCAEIDFLVDTARTLSGCYGARMTGGGFGGCTVNLVETAKVEAFSETVLQQYKAQFGIEGKVYVCSASDGALALAGREDRS